MREVFVLQAIYSISIVALEIPSGYIADVYGRKKAIVFGSIMGFIGYGIYSFTNGFTGFLFAEIILGIGQSMISGADSALLFVSLAEYRKENEYLKIEGRMVSIGNFAEATAGIIGGLLAGVSIRYPYYFQTAVSFIAIPAAIRLIEPNVLTKNIEFGWSNIISIVKYSLISNNRLKWSIIYSSIIGASTLTMAWFVQPWLIRLELPVRWYGIVWTILNLSVGISALYAYKLEIRLGRTATAFVFTTVLAFGFISISFINSYFGLIILLLFYISRGIATPILKDYINQLAPSSMRATVLSVRNFIIRIIFAIWGPLYGWITDKISLKMALLAAGLIFTFASSISLFYFSKAYQKNDLELDS